MGHYRLDELRSALNDAVREGLIVTNPAALVKMAGGKRPKALVWTVEREARWRGAVAAHIAAGKTPPEARAPAPRPSPVMVWRPDHLGAFLDVAAGDRLYALFHLIAYRGLRRGEAAGLEWQDVDLDGAAVTVRR